MAHEPKLTKATFAGGCFWCIQPVFETLKGVKTVTVGYTGGRTANPTYEEVCSGRTGHAEAVQILYDPAQITYEQLLDAYWRNIDPTTKNSQFVDVGDQYRTAIFYHSEEQKRLAEASKEKLQQSGRFHKPIVTEIVPAVVFYPAENYHQDYYKKCPLRYNSYHHFSGRDSFFEKIWGKKS
jgi:methionine-S-sulfoxide reductase